MTNTNQDQIAEQLAEIRLIIMDREGEEVQDQFEVEDYLICINIEGSGYEDPEDENAQGLFTLIQIEKGPIGMEQLIACALEQFSLSDAEAEGDHFIATGEMENLSEILDDVREKVYRHWHWLDMPSTLDQNDADLIDDEDDLDL